MPEVVPPPVRTPASPAQQGVWLTERLGLAREAFHMPLRVSLEQVDPAALAGAVRRLVERHPALSVRLVEDGGQVWQERVAQRPELLVAAAPRDEAELEKLLEDEAARPFDRDRGPLARFALHRRPDGSGELLVVVHHAVFDGNSKDVLLADLAAGYAAASAGRPPAPAAAPAPAAPPVPPQAGPETVRRAAAWYGSRWAGAGEPFLPGALGLPVTAGPGEQTAWRLDAAERAALAEAARRGGVTVFEHLLAALHALLLRYGGEAVPVSVPLSTRTPELAGEIGLFVNELPVHPPAVAGPADDFAGYARAVRAELRGGYPYRAVPFGAAVAGLGPRVGLTPVSFGYRRRGPAPVFGAGAARVHWAVSNRTARNTLHLQAVDAADGLDLALQYDPAVLAPQAARRIAGHYRTLLAASVAAPHTPVADLPLLDAAELHALTAGADAAVRPYPADRTVLDLFRDRAAATPDAPAVSAGDHRLTYRQLLARTEEVAAAVRAAGVRPGDLVALHLGRTADLPAALLGVLAAGAAYLPLDPGYPAQRLAGVLADSGAVLLLADRTPAPEVAAVAPAVLPLPPAAASPATTPAPADAPAAAPTPGDVAYVLYTSGSTGRPKGVAVGHRALVNLLTSFADRLGAGPRDVWLGLTSLSFDISALEVLLPLVTGGRLVVAPEGLAVDGPGLLALLAGESVSHVQATPSGWRVLLGGPVPAAGDPLAAVTALAGGEALPLPLAGELRARTARLFNVYGPTETTVWSTCAEIPAAPGHVDLGRPIANTRVLVADARLRPVPVGVPGELLIGGDGLAHGYLGRPGLTALRFVPDPYGPPGARLYRTGDLVVRTPDGGLDFLGRTDDQVKIRGHRIELGEVEAALLTHPAVAEAAVAVRTDRPGPADGPAPDESDAPGAGEGAGEPYLAGYLVPVPGAVPPVPAELRDHLLRTLPAATVPQRWLVLERLPLTPNGKLDRRALPVPPREAAPEPAAAAAGTGADDEVTAAVRRIWAEVLDLPDVGPHEDLFDLGGHSLTVIRISARIRDVLGVELDFDLFFDASTPAGIAAAIRERS